MGKLCRESSNGVVGRAYATINRSAFVAQYNTAAMKQTLPRVWSGVCLHTAVSQRFVFPQYSSRSIHLRSRNWACYALQLQASFSAQLG